MANVCEEEARIVYLMGGGKIKLNLRALNRSLREIRATQESVLVQLFPFFTSTWLKTIIFNAPLKFQRKRSYRNP